MLAMPAAKFKMCFTRWCPRQASKFRNPPTLFRRKKGLVQKNKEGYLMNYLILAMPKRALIRRETGLSFYACCRKQRDDCGEFSD